MNQVLNHDSEREYSAGLLTKGTVSLEELITLFKYWQPGESEDTFSKRVQNNTLLTKQTARRTRDLVHMFGAWFLKPDDQPAQNLKTLVAADLDLKGFRELVFLYKARTETVLYDFTKQVFWPLAHDGALYLRTQDVEDFLQDAQQKGLAAKGWAQETQARLARGIMKALVDSGFIHQENRTRREIVSYHVTDLSVAYVANELHLNGVSDGILVEHPDWSLFGLQRQQTLIRLSDLGERGGLIVQYAGSVVTITWKYESMNKVITAYVR